MFPPVGITVQKGIITNLLDLRGEQFRTVIEL
jgi:hypothetical protein